MIFFNVPILFLIFHVFLLMLLLVCFLFSCLGLFSKFILASSPFSSSFSSLVKVSFSFSISLFFIFSFVLTSSSFFLCIFNFFPTFPPLPILRPFLLLLL
uniref:Uncharacterized protein n=1 Tax=Cacopsylla melanoneura TaxID=428564 RepID=A0A8D9F4F0_9HEMI